MEDYRVVIEPRGRGWGWQVQKARPYASAVDAAWRVVQHGFDHPLEGKARTFEKAARSATAELGRIYAEEKREALVATYRGTSRVKVVG